MCQDMRKTTHEINGVAEPYFGFAKVDAISDTARTFQAWLNKSQC